MKQEKKQEEKEEVEAKTNRKWKVYFVVHVETLCTIFFILNWKHIEQINKYQNKNTDETKRKKTYSLIDGNGHTILLLLVFIATHWMFEALYAY